MFITAINTGNNSINSALESALKVAAERNKKAKQKAQTNNNSNLQANIKATIQAKLNELIEANKKKTTTTQPPVVQKPAAPPVPPPVVEAPAPPPVQPPVVQQPIAPPVSEVVPPPTPTYDFSYLPFDPTKISVGDAYAKVARLDNDETSVTYREQLAATKLLNSGFYQSTPLNGISNIEFLRNASQSSSVENTAYKELTAMSQMPMFSDLFKELQASGQSIKIMVSNYGESFAASNISLTDQNGKKVNVITVDPNYVDFDYSNPNKRNIISALSNELQEIAARIQESKQGVSYVATRPFQEGTLAVDQLMEDFLYDFAARNRVDFKSLTPEQRSNALRLMSNWSPENLTYHLNRNLDWVNSTQGYANFREINNSTTVLLSLTELNKKLDYLLGANRKVTFTAKRNSAGNFYFEVVKI